MGYLPWSIPIVAVVAMLVAGRTSAMAGFGGFAAALAVALSAAPNVAGLGAALDAALRGAWLAVLVGAVIVGGLFFREVAIGGISPPASTVPAAATRRKHLFAASFLVGPFAEAATGFGVGQVTVAAALQRLRLPILHAAIFGLFSQTMVPWGAMANGTIVGSQASGVSPVELGVHSALLTAPLLLVWLGFFWHFARAAGVAATLRDLWVELACTVAVAVLLVACNAVLGPEVAGMAALAPVIAVRYLTLEPRTLERWRYWTRLAAPYLALIALLALTRAIEPLNDLLAAAVVLQPFVDGAVMHPLLHPAFWLLVVGLLAAVISGRWRSILPAARLAWTAGQRPVLTIMTFLAMAQIMVDAGAAEGAAAGIRLLLGDAAVLATPVLAALFGFLTSSGNAANGLLMPAQAALALQIGVAVPWLAAIQNVAASAMTMLSPVRIAMGCAQFGRPNLEGAVYRQAWPMGALPVMLLMGAAGSLVLVGGGE